MAQSQVNYNHLGRSGVRVSNLCLGTFTFGKAVVYSSYYEFLDVPTQADETLSHQIMDRYIELGGNFLDTANIYGHGASESVIGNWLRKQDRSELIVATKVGYPMNNSVNSDGLGRRHIVESCEQSLERLQTSGLLTGKFKRDQKPERIGSRIGFVHIDETKAIHAAPAWSQYNSDDSYWNLITKLTEIAKKYGRSVAQVSLRWLLQKDMVASVVFGATSVKQLEDNMGAASGWMLTDDEMTCLDNAYPRRSMYPYDQNVRMDTFNRSNKI